MTKASKKLFITNKRFLQAKYWMHETINENLKNSFYNNETIKKQIPELEEQIANEKISSFAAAKILLNKYYNSNK